jgi:hypothetical protein
MFAIATLAALTAACGDSTPAIDAPTNLSYTVEASGDPTAPSGVLLRWSAVDDPLLSVYRVYSRPDRSTSFGLRGSTTSTSFHDVGLPHLEYYVTAVNTSNRESPASSTVVVDERLRLDAPGSLTTTSLNGAVYLFWSDNSFKSEPTGFKQYRVYSASYDLDQNICGTWAAEGTTVSPEFVASALTNGVSRCFAVSAESVEGFESLFSPTRADTPRPDARNVLLWPVAVDLAHSGFRFFLDANGDGQAGALELGSVTAGDRTDIDFRVDRDAKDTLYLTPIRAGTKVALYGTTTVEDLTSIDIAPTTGYATSAIQALPGYGYVFQMSGGDAFARFGAIRVTHASKDLLIVDWSYQTDPGNPELLIHGGLAAYLGSGIVVPTGR